MYGYLCTNKFRIPEYNSYQKKIHLGKKNLLKYGPKS